MAKWRFVLGTGLHGPYLAPQDRTMMKSALETGDGASKESEFMPNTPIPPATHVLIVSAGKGVRAGGALPKQYVRLGGETGSETGGEMVLTRTIRAFVDHPLVSAVTTVINPADIDHYRRATAPFNNADRLLPPATGGKTRQESVCNGLRALAPHRPDLVLIHDAARPFVDAGTISRVIEALARHEAVLPVLPVSDTIKQVERDRVRKTVERANLVGAQTPQGFHFPLIFDLHQRAEAEGNSAFTDDASLAEGAGKEVFCVEGHADNQKLTTRRDMKMAELHLSQTERTQTNRRTTRIGSGFDVHRFEPGDGVTLCGVKIPFDRKLQGHSDADVALHALTDALYGALGAGDIGTHFPPDDPQWKGTESKVFLAHAAEMVRQRGGEINNVDLTLICERPKIRPHQSAMRAGLSHILSLDAHRISIKATTTEQLGFTGREEGIAAQAVALISVPESVEKPEEPEAKDQN